MRNKEFEGTFWPVDRHYWSGSITCLSFSGGTQSSYLAWQVIRGEIEFPKPFYIMFADPGMEKEGTYEYIERIRVAAGEAGIPFMRGSCGNLFNDLTQHRRRIDNPPYWVKKEDGKSGQLMQACTKEYKTAVLKRMTRRALRHHGIKPRPGCVTAWVGFTADEEHRVIKDDVDYIVSACPLRDRGVTKQDVFDWYERLGIPLPPRSLCNGCPFHGLRMLKDLYKNPRDWAEAVEVDKAIRHGIPGVDMSNGATLYVSSTLVPLEELAANNFSTGNKLDDDLHQCSSGMCFV